jgi:hypothetical protein
MDAAALCQRIEERAGAGSLADAADRAAELREYIRRADVPSTFRTPTEA